MRNFLVSEGEHTKFGKRRKQCSICKRTWHIRRKRRGRKRKRIAPRLAIRMLMGRSNLFSGSLPVWNVRLGTVQIFCSPNPNPPQAGEDRIPFELIQEYTANWENAG